MAREASITFEQLAVVANQIKSDGGKVTSRSVREVLGSGSQATVCKLLLQWQDGQVRKSEAIDDTLSLAVAKAISNEISNKVQTATADATARLADLQVEYKGLIAETENQSADIDYLNAELASLQVRHSELNGKHEQSQLELEKTNTALVAERLLTNEAKTELVKSAMKLESLPKIEAELSAVREQLASEKAISAKLHETEAVAVAKLEIINNSLVETSKRLTTVQDELNREKLISQSLQNRIDMATRDLSHANGIADKQASELQRLHDIVASSNKSADELRGMLALANQENLELKAHADEIHKEKKPVGRPPKAVVTLVAGNS